MAFTGCPSTCQSDRFSILASLTLTVSLVKKATSTLLEAVSTSFNLRLAYATDKPHDKKTAVESSFKHCIMILSSKSKSSIMQEVNCGAWLREPPSIRPRHKRESLCDQGRYKSDGETDPEKGQTVCFYIEKVSNLQMLVNLFLGLCVP